MDKLKMQSPNLVEQNIDKIAELFPNCITEGRNEKGRVKRAVDFDLLRQELSASLVEGPRERYTLNWPGKNEAILTANAPIAKTLRPCKEESVDFENTRNLFIEGDNLDVLKLLQETYLGKVKVIYIDPPYNTGNDFIYDDDFAEDAEAFLQRSNQKDEAGNRLVANPETKGRFHSDWLTMMFPRLKLARNLLQEDGVIMISIGDTEIDNLRKICAEVFGAENLVASLVWEKGRKNDAKLFSVGHEYILVYAKSLGLLKEKKTVWREEKPGAREIWDEYVRLRVILGPDDKKIENEIQIWFKNLPKKHPSKKWARYRRIDANGPWRDRDISWPGGDGPTYDVIHPKTGKPCKVPERGWIYASPDEMQRQIKLGLVVFRDDHTEPPFRKAHIRPVTEELDDNEESDNEDNGEEELATQVRGSYFYKQSQVSVKYLRKLMDGKVFDNPKDHEEIARLLKYVLGANSDEIVMDFFGGSGSTAEAVLQVNSEQGTNHKFILVQLSEPCKPKEKSGKAALKLGYSTISDICKERIRRASRKIQAEQVDKEKNQDFGLRVFKVDTSNLKDVYYTPDQLKQGNLDLFKDHIKPDRRPEDLVFQVFLDWGLDLTLPIAKETIDGKTVFFVDTNALLACFDSGITEEIVKKLAKRKPLRAVFRDDAFGSDSLKINVEQIFKTLSPSTEVKSI